jgi:ankyrin repeat protein
VKTLPDTVSRSTFAKVAEFLSHGGDLHAVDSKERNGLHRAARLGKTEIARMLIDRGLDVNGVDASGEAALQMACRNGHLDLARLLVACGAELNYVPSPELTEYSETALCSTVRKGRLEVLEFLLKAGADPNCVSSAKRYPLHAAIWWNTGFQILRLLIEHGADLSIIDKQGNDALHVAVTAESLEETERLELCRLLLQKGAIVNSQNMRGETALHKAVCCGDLAVVKHLVENGANLECHDETFGMTPLEMAIKRGRKEIGGLLRDAGAVLPRPAEWQESEEDVGIPVSKLSHEERRQLDSAEQLEAEIEKIVVRLVRELKHQSLAFVVENWKCSRSHMRILRALDQPLDIKRIAYFGRGMFTRGGRLDDGCEFLGESYRDCVERFLEEGLAHKLTPEETVLLATNLADLKRKANSLGLKVSGTKRQLMERCLGRGGTSLFSDVLKSNTYYLRTPKGSEVLQKADDVLEEVESRWKRHCFSALKAKDITTALLLAWQIQTLKNGRRAPAPFDIESVVALMLSESNVFVNLDAASFLELKAAYAVEKLWKGEAFANWIRHKPVIAEFTEPVTAEVLKNILVYGIGVKQLNRDGFINLD